MSAICISAGATLCGCTNPFIESYQSFLKGPEADSAIAGAHVTVYRTDDLSARVKSLLADGYAILGVSAFVTVDVGIERNKAVQFGKENNADVVILWDIPATASSITIPSGLPPRFRRFAGEQCGVTSMVQANRAYVGIAMAKPHHEK